MLNREVIINTATRPGACNTKTGLTKPLEEVEVQLMNSLSHDGTFFVVRDYLFEERFTFPNLSLPSWETIKDRYPRMAQRMLDEYHRVNGLVPFETGFVYLIHAEGSDYYKIGKTTKPERRLLQISPKMPFKTRFIKIWRSYFMSEAETMLHEMYSSQRANGEWFELDESDLYALLRSYTFNEIQYAYAARWNRVIYGDNCNPVDREEITRLRDDALPMDEFLNKFNFLRMADVHTLGYDGYLFLPYIEYYFDSIARSLDEGLPSDINALLDELEEG